MESWNSGWLGWREAHSASLTSKFLSLGTAFVGAPSRDLCKLLLTPGSVEATAYVSAVGEEILHLDSGEKNLTLF